jgi:hypothetical protein
MARYFRFTYTDEGISTQARLLEREAPRTVEVLWAQAPYEGLVGHAIFSGTTCALYIDPTIVIPTEHATHLVQKGDLLFTHYDAMERHGFPDPLSEIYWAYDRYCRPTQPGTMAPVYPNVFGTFELGCEAFFAASQRIRYDGRKRLQVERLEA